MAEAVRFELTVPFDTTVFKTVAISRTLPRFRKKRNSREPFQEQDPERIYGAANEVRTRDIYLGKVVLYQLSYSRILIGAGERSRTLDLLITSELLYQLSYAGNIITYKYLHE